MSERLTYKTLVKARLPRTWPELQKQPVSQKKHYSGYKYKGCAPKIMVSGLQSAALHLR